MSQQPPPTNKGGFGLGVGLTAAVVAAIVLAAVIVAACCAGLAVLPLLNEGAA